MVSFLQDVQTHNPIHLVADGLLKEREVFHQSEADVNQAKNWGGRTTRRVWTLLFAKFTLAGLSASPRLRAIFWSITRLGRPRVHHELQPLDVAN